MYSVLSSPEVGRHLILNQTLRVTVLLWDYETSKGNRNNNRQYEVVLKSDILYKLALHISNVPQKQHISCSKPEQEVALL